MNYSKNYESVGAQPPGEPKYEACLMLTADLCPYIRRIFITSMPTDDTAAVIVHDHEW